MIRQEGTFPAARRNRRMTTAVACAAVVPLMMTACGGESSDESSRTLTVYAAASLTDSFEDLAQSFEEDHPGVDVQLSFAGSSTLVTQLQDGASADVFASADEATMDKAVDAGLVDGDPSIFAINQLTIAVPTGNPTGVTGFKDLTRDGLNVVICEARVPCGAATEKLEEVTGVSLNPVSEESAVTDVMGKVTSGQADAGVVYRTDVAAAGDAVEDVAISQADQAINNYPIATLDAARDKDLAREFVAMIEGPTGQQRLAQGGFGAP